MQKLLTRTSKHAVNHQIYTRIQLKALQYDNKLAKQVVVQQLISLGQTYWDTRCGTIDS